MVLISFTEASEALGIHTSALFNKKLPKYHDFIVPGEGFDILGYKRREDILDDMVETTKLFIEYLNKVEELSYEKIAALGGSDKKSMSTLDLKRKKSLKFLVNILKNEPLLIERFDSYYNYNIIAKHRHSIKVLEGVKC